MTSGTGATTRQMEAALPDSVFIWVNGHLDYPKRLARELGRVDLQIVSPLWLESQAWRGRRFSGVTLDHAAELTDLQQEYFRVVLTRLEPTQ